MARPRKVPPHSIETVAVADLKPHERNYRDHPAAQVKHLEQSIREHGLYRNVVVANDGTILAGHGVVAACKKIGLTEIPVIRVPVAPDSPAAIRILTGDNELARLAVVDDARLSDLLSSLQAADPVGLLGTGYDETMLARLRRVVEASSGSVDAFAEWAGMPEFEQASKLSAFRCVVHFATLEDADRFFAEAVGGDRRVSVWWPEPDGHVGSTVKDEWVGDA